MKKIISSFLTIAFLSSNAFSLTDLGTYGPLYRIQEKNIKTVIKKALIDKKDEIKKAAKKAFESGLIYHSTLPFSKKDVIVKHNTTLRIGNHTVDLKSSPYPISDSLCIVNFETFNILDQIVNKFGKKCRYVFLNVDIRKISKNGKYNYMKKFIGNNVLFSMFNVSATPVKITVSKESIKFHYLDYKKIKAEVKQKLLKKF